MRPPPSSPQPRSLLSEPPCSPRPAAAAPIEKGRFHDTETTFFTCDTNGLPIQQVVDGSGSFIFNQRGPSPFPYGRESVRATTTWTNLENGGTFTNVWTANFHDAKITDNGDGTITIDITPRAAPGTTTTPGTSCSRTPAASGSASSSTTTAPPPTPRTTPSCPSRCSATPPAATTPRAGTSATTCCIFSAA